jgi:hypothetical protein
MSRTNINIYLLFFYFIFQNFTSTYSQFKFSAGAGAGYYSSSGTSIIGQSDLHKDFDGQLVYNYIDDIRNAGIKLIVHPEFYGSNNLLTTLNFYGDGSYTQDEKSFNWGFRLNNRLDNFNGRNINLSYDIFNALAEGNLFFLKDFPLNITTGYGFQKIKDSTGQTLDYFLLDLKTSTTLSSIAKIGYGIYSESFSVTAMPASGRQQVNVTPGRTGTINQNKGWRFGPQTGFYYLKDEIVNFDYHFLVHISDLTNNFSYEQWIHLVAGKLFSDKWSVFFLSDLYFRKFNLNELAENNLNLLYTSNNLDNHIYLKTGYDVSDHFEIYIRIGYFKENLVNNKYSYSGWDTTLGIELGN